MKIKKKFKLAERVLFFLVQHHSDIDPSKVKLFKGMRNQDFGQSSGYGVWMNPDIALRDIVWLICHEFVHIIQHHEKRLIIRGDKIIFEGVEYNAHMDYYKSPWEIEAYSRQDEFRKLWENRKQ